MKVQQQPENRTTERAMKKMCSSKCAGRFPEDRNSMVHKVSLAVVTRLFNVAIMLEKGKVSSFNTFTAI